ncbi:outer membrane protein [Helicobacter ailurogastricus]|uniref:outer membrane protein n=1 Tax=Helicobacter ailurogastricus TaxID=1578720 RepID=UPI000CF107F2|nr:outer membrane protein [Helicobacter ailurogastricus]
MKRKSSKRLRKTSFSLALVSCLSPGLDAADITVENLVNSVSGLLGGNYQLSSGSYNGPDGLQSWNTSGNLAPIYNPTGASGNAGTALTGNASNGFGIGNATDSASTPVSNPYPANWNLFGNANGLISTILGSSGDGLDIYSFGPGSNTNNAILGLMNQYTNAYNNRISFSGVSAANNLLGSGAQTGYYTATPTTGTSPVAYKVTGNLQASQIASGSNQGTADGLLGTIYQNMNAIIDNSNLYVNTGAGLNTAYDSAFSTLNTAGDGILSAITALTSTDATTKASSFLDSLNNVLYSSANTTTNSLINSSTYAFNGSGAGLTTLQAINNIRGMIDNGLVTASTSSGTTTYTLNSNYTNALTALSAMSPQLDVIANNTLNSNAVSAVFSALQGLPAVGTATLSDVATALNGLVNPNAYQAVYQAYEQITGNGTVVFNPSNGSFSTTTATSTDSLGDFKNALSSQYNGSLASAFQAALTLEHELKNANAGLGNNSNLQNLFPDWTVGGNNSVPNTTGGNAPTNANLQALYNAFESNTFGGSAKTSAWGALDSLLQQVNPYVSTANIKVDNTLKGGTANPTTIYPLNVQNGGVTDTSSTNTSWTSQQATNQAAYNKQYMTNLSNLLTNVLTYSNNVNTFKGMLSSSASLNNILNAGINNAAANKMYNSQAAEAAGKADAVDNQAQVLNNIKALFRSETLLGDYINALTKNWSSTSQDVNQVNQANGLAFMYNALSASQAQNGLIAQTKAAIEAQLNTNFVLSPTLASSSNLQNDLSIFSSGTFSSTASTSQIAQGLGALVNLQNAFNNSSPSTSGASSNFVSDIRGVQSFNNNMGTLTDSSNATALGGLKIQSGQAGMKTDTTLSASNLDAALAALVVAVDGGATADNALTTVFGATYTTWATSNSALASAFTSLLSGSGSYATLQALLANAPTGSGPSEVDADAFGAVVTQMSNLGSYISAANTALSSSGQLPTATAGLGGTNVLTTQTFDNIFNNLQNLSQNLGAFAPSIKEQFATGNLSASQLLGYIQNDINNIKAYAGLDSNAGQSTQQGSDAMSGSGLQGILKAAGISSAQSLGFANAAINTLSNTLNGLLPLLNTPSSNNGVFTTSDFSSYQTLVSNLSSAVLKLYQTDPNFFVNATVGATANTGKPLQYNLNNVNALGNQGTINGGTFSSANNSSIGFPLSSGSGAHYYAQMGINDPNAGAYIGNLQALATINGLIGSIVQQTSSNGIYTNSTPYTALFTNPGGASASVVSVINTNAATLQSYLGTNVSMEAFVGALMTINTGSASSNNYAAVIHAVQNLTNQTINASDAQAIWKAFDNIYYKTANGAASGTTYIDELGSNLSNKLTPNTVANVAQIITDAQSLFKANQLLAGNTNTDTSKNINGTITNNASGVLKVTQGNAQQYLTAQTAAQQVGALMQALKAGDDATPSQVVQFIKDIDSYTHNVNLLNSLTTGGSQTAQGNTLASDVLNYVQGNAVGNAQNPSYSQLTNNAAASYTGSGAAGALSKLYGLETLVNRLQYLENLQGQLQTAINNNPYAMVMQKNDLIQSNQYQSIAEKIVTEGKNNGLFSAAASKEFSSMNGSNIVLNPNTGSATSPTPDSFTAFSNTVTSSLQGVSAWNSLVSGLNNGDSSVLLPGIPFNTNVVKSLGNVNTAVGNLTGFIVPISDTSSSAASSVASAINSIYSSYAGGSGNTNSGIGTLLNAQIIATDVFSQSQFQFAANSTGALGLSALTQQVESTGYTPLEGMQGLSQINIMLGNKLLADNGALSANATAAFGSSSTTGIQGLDASLSAIAGLFSGIVGTGNTDSASTLTDGKASNLSGINFDKLTTMGNYGTDTFIQGLVGAIVNASGNVTGAKQNLLYYLENPTDVVSSSPTTNQATEANVAAALQAALSNFLGSSITKATFKTSVNAGTNASTLLTDLNAILSSSGTLGQIEAVLSGGQAAPGSGSVYTGSTLANALTQVQQFAKYYNAANGVLGDSSGAKVKTGIANWVDGVTTANTAAYLQDYTQLVNDVNAIFGVSTGLTGNLSIQGVVNTQQAMAQYTESLKVPSLYTGSYASNTTLSGSIAGLMAAALKAEGVSGAVATNNGNSTTKDSIASYIANATPAQIQAAAQAVVDNTGGNYNGFVDGENSQSMHQTLNNFTLGKVLAAAQNYSDAMGTLTPLLNPSNQNASVQKILDTSIGNVTSLGALAQLLNSSASIDVNGTSVSVSSLLGNPSTLSPAVVAAIKQLLTKMEGVQGQVNTFQQNIDNNATASLLNGLQGTNGYAAQAQNALSSLVSRVGVTNQTINNYLTNEDKVIQARVDFLLNNQANTLGALLLSLQKVSQQSFQGNADAAISQLNTDISNVFNQIVQSDRLNPTQADANLQSIINALTNLQSSLLGQLAGMAGVSGATGGGGAAVAAVEGVQAEHAKGSITLPVVNAGTPSAITTQLNAVNNALVLAKASLSKMQTELKAMGYNVSKNGVVAMSNAMHTMNSNGNMYGIDVQFGYKQFFGKKKRWGVRYYANFSYQHGTFMVSNAAELDNFVYGAGVDALYNFYESKDGKYTTGLFAGLMLDGSSWAVKGQSYYDSLVAQGLGKMNTSYFQIPINLGFRTNVNKHNGFEIGLRIPLATNYYYKGLNEFGDKLDIAYKRNVSVFFNYVYNF